jgi:hypothetical protein
MTPKTNQQKKAEQRKRDAEALDRYAQANGFKSWGEMLKYIRREYNGKAER